MSRSSLFHAGRVIALGLLAVGTTLAMPTTPASAQSVEAEVDSVAERLDEARSRNLHLIAPRLMERASERLGQARQRLERGGNIGEIRDRLDQAREALSEAQELYEVGQVLLRDAIEAREAALRANAPQHATELWREATSRLEEAGRKVEDGDQNDARNKAAQARSRFREAELTAIERTLLGTARELREAARDADAQKTAPKTLVRADSLLQRAESMLQQDRSRQEDVSAVAERAARQYRHAARIAAQADSFDTNFGVETLMLRAETQLERIAEQLNFDPRFDEGLRPVTREIVAAIESLQSDRSSLQSRLQNLQEELRGQLEEERARVDSLEQRLAELGEREAQVSAELRERRRREQKLQEIQAIFAEDEAEVLLARDELIVRLRALSFPSGSAEIRPENFSLLTKVQRVIREFPDAGVEIRGHTDAQGNAEYNQSLSQRRAIAVREYLLANMAISADRVSARGFGESQPVATNDTPEGRAQNRRIDVAIDLSEF